LAAGKVYASPLKVPLRGDELGCGSGLFGPAGGDLGGEPRICRLQALNLADGVRKLRLRFCIGDLRVRVVELNKNVPTAHPLGVVDPHSLDRPADEGRDLGHVRTHVGVVGLDVAIRPEDLVARIGAGDDHCAGAKPSEKQAPSLFSHHVGGLDRIV
jgi:hypothetical protein